MSVTLPAEWTQPSGCLASTDVWYWTVISESFYGDILGAPTATVDCYPPDYKPTIGPAYTAASCPDGFSSGGSANVFSGSWSTVCCPSGAYTMSAASATFGSVFLGCGFMEFTGSGIKTTFTRTATVFGHDDATLDSFTWDFISEITDVSPSTTLTTTLSTTVVASGSIVAPIIRTNEAVLWGMGVGIVTPTSTSTASDSNSGLSSGAAAGIGVGVTLAVVALLAAGGWLFWRRRRGGPDKAPVPPEAHLSPVYGKQPRYTPPYELSTQERPGELVAHRLEPGELE